MSLPGILAEIAEVAGEDAALAIARVRGGTEVYFPPVPAGDHWLCHLIGGERAKAVCDLLTTSKGARIEIPLGPTGAAASARARVDALLGEDVSERDIARRTGYTIRAIRKRRKKLGIRRNSNQLSLF